MASGTENLKAPFPYFGGKSTIARAVWKRFGDVRNYVEPFFGSGAMLLNRPEPFVGTETVNDKDGLVSNFWRAVQHDPDAVAFYADWPVNENDLTARHLWLVSQKDALDLRLSADPEFYDCKVAGWWCWGMCCWIGSGFCSGEGPWRAVADAEGVRQLVHLGNAGQGVNRKRVHLGNAGQGVNRKRVHLGDAGRGVNRQRVHLGDAGRGEEGSNGTPGRASTASESTSGTAVDETDGEGVNRKMPHMNNHGSPPRGIAGAGDGVSRKRPLITNDSVGIVNRSEGVYEWMRSLSERLKRVRVCSGDWSRVCGPTVTVKQGLTAVFLDPPYADTAGRQADLYREDCDQVAHAVREWAIEWGADRRIRIALCGYEGEHAMPDDWDVLEWKAKGGYGSQGDDEESGGRANARKERVWFSPHCLKANRQKQAALFSEASP